MGLPAKIDFNATPTAGQKLVVAIPRDVSYEELNLILNYKIGAGADVLALTPAQWAAAVDTIRLVIGGRSFGAIDIVNAQSDKLAVLNRYYDEARQTPGVLPLYFSRPWMKEVANGIDHGILGLLGTDTAKLEITFVAGITINQFEVWGKTQAARQPGQIVRVIQEEMNIAKAGDYSGFQFDRSDYAFIGLHFDTTQFNRVEMRVNRRLAHESISFVRASLANGNDKTEQAGYTHIDFNPRNELGIMLPMNVSTYELKVNSTAAPGAVSIVKEMFETITNQ